MFKFHNLKNLVKKPSVTFAVGALTLGAVAATAVPSHASPVLDFSGMATSITGEITPALASAMPIAGVLLGVAVAWKLFRRFVK